MTTTHWVLVGVGVAALAALGLVAASLGNHEPSVTMRTEAVVVSASDSEVLVDFTQAGTKTSARAASAVVGEKGTVDVLLRGFVYALAGVGLSIGLKYLARVKILRLEGLRMAVTTVASCLGVGGGITAIFRDSWFWWIGGGAVAFMAAYVIYQFLIKKHS